METSIGPYRIDGELGRGGMGVVYRAVDTRLDRAVAIKALPTELAADPSRLERFEREAKTLAQLNHPNLAGIHGLEEHEGARYLVLEFVEGSTLADRLDAGPLPPDEAIEIAAQIADGIAAAHDAGVVHRDLKPANVIITPEGNAKVLDFGLARTDDGLSSTGSSEAMTVTSPARHSPTMPGVILGTAAYMSPEQARGRRVDKRTDVWSFGVLLYEMLTGASPFVGETATDSVGAILHKYIDLETLPPATPPGVRRVLTRCLERDRNQRYRDIADVRLELLAATSEPADQQDGSASARRIGWGLAGVAAIAGAAVGAGLLWSFAPRDAATGDADDTPRRYSITLPAHAPIAPASAYPFGLSMSMFEVTRDGSTLYYTALVNGRPAIYRRDMRTGEVGPVPGGEGGTDVAVSDDGRWLAFFRDDRLFALDTLRGTDPEPLAEATSGTGIDWGPDGAIYFNPGDNQPIYVTRPDRGRAAARAVTETDVYFHGSPAVSHDGASLLFRSSADGGGIRAVAASEPGPSTLVFGGALAAAPLGSDTLLMLLRNRLAAARFDQNELRVLGQPTTILSDVRSNRFTAQFTLDDSGAMIYLDGGSEEIGEFVWVAPGGGEQPAGLPLADYEAFQLSPDGSRLATAVASGGNQDIWIYDLDRPLAPARITNGGSQNSPVWSSDGRFLLFTRSTSSANEAWVKDTSSSAPPFKIEGLAGNAIPRAYNVASGDLLFTTRNGTTRSDIRRATVDLSTGAGATATGIEPIAATPYIEPFAHISPDRAWIVVNSDETGRWELFLSTYPEGNQRVQISTSGGEEPYWTPDGSRVIYRWDDTWYSVAVETTPMLRVSNPEVLLRGPYINVGGYSWDRHPETGRLLLLKGPLLDTPITELQVITNFDAEVEQALSTN